MLIIVDNIFSHHMQFVLPLNQKILIIQWYLGAVITNGIYLYLNLVFSFELKYL